MSARRSTLTRWWFFAAISAGNALLLWWFYDRYWYPVDEGNYAHIAERLLGGDVLHLDIQDLHPGYINLLNALAFWLFGFDLVSLRYPLALASLIQACLVFAYISRRDVLLASVASVSVTALGVIQFLNPTAHWYCLFLSVALVGWLAYARRGSIVRTVGAGLLVGLIALFRQLTGVWVAMAVLVLFLLEHSENARGRQTILARTVLGLLLLALVAYLVVARGPGPGGIVLMASWPIAVLLVVLDKVTTTNRTTARILTEFTIGAFVAALPMLTYHLVYGSVVAWFDDIAVASVALTQLNFFDGGWFSLLSIAGFYQALSSADVVKIANGLYWGFLPIVPAANGLLLLRRLFNLQDTAMLALPMVAAFYSLVSLHLEGPTYLYYAIGLPLSATLWMAATAQPWKRFLCASAAASIAVVAILFHAGQSFSRTSVQVLEGRRTFSNATPMCQPFARSSLRVERADCDEYHELVSAVQSVTSAREYIFALPSDAELYFLANRPNPFRFYNTALGVRTDAELNAVLQTLVERPPRLVAYRPDDKYNTPASRRIMEYVRSAYERFDTIGRVELYRVRSSGLSVQATLHDR